MSTHRSDAIQAAPTERPVRFDVWLSNTKTLAGGFSVRTKILGIILVLTTVLGLGITWQVRAAMNAITANELDSRGQAQTLELATRIAEPLSRNNSVSVSQILDETVAQHPDTMFALITDPDGDVIAHSFGEAGPPSELVEIEPQIGEQSAQHADITSEDGLVHTFAETIPDGEGSVARLGLSEARLGKAIDGITLQLLVTTLFVGLVGVVAATLLTWLLTRPILDLVGTTRRVARGDLSVRASVWAEDEIGSLADSFNQMVKELESNRTTIAENEEVRTRLLKQLIGAQEDERKRIARELHDSIGQALSSIMLGASLIERSDAPQEQRSRADELRQLSAETLEHVRKMSRELRPSVLDDLGLAAALDRYAAEFQLRHPEIVADLHCDLSERLPSVVETTLYRVVQEGMTNVARHSGARMLSVLVTQRDGTVQAIIEDNGVGFDPVQAARNGESVGIHGMVERVELLSGRLDIESNRNGTAVYIEIPVGDTSEVVS
ncbi:MAG: HAMP domain-containing protein [Acidimicrobiia bacterium]